MDRNDKQLLNRKRLSDNNDLYQEDDQLGADVIGDINNVVDNNNHNNNETIQTEHLDAQNDDCNIIEKNKKQNFKQKYKKQLKEIEPKKIYGQDEEDVDIQSYLLETDISKYIKQKKIQSNNNFDDVIMYIIQPSVNICDIEDDEQYNERERHKNTSKTYLMF